MPIQWKAKAAGEIVEREWDVPVTHGESVISFTVSVSGATLDQSERSGDIVTFTLSGGTNGATAIATLTATTARGLVLNETAYLPIRATPNAFNYNVNSVLTYALRPIVGLSATATAAELEDARENLDDMLAFWAEQGANLQVKLPTDVNDTLYVPDYAISAMKSALRVRLSGLYGKPVDIEDFKAAQRGLQQVKMALLPIERRNVFF
jgi:hypothetical protein